ncbi:S-Ena type endospore appendage [Pontibacillus sp. HMF3514]|uniref:S-Ena type endospore appendage n=1 Tax=Pontibacillus sp. HMF3514 TaxID=2692425 RepID=UPI00351B9873
MSTCKSSNFKTDVFEHCFTIHCGTRKTLWEVKDQTKVCGSFTLNIENACESVLIIVNGMQVISKPQSITIPPTQQGDLTYSYTSGNLESIEVLCNDPDQTEGKCKINLCLKVHYLCC